MRSVACEFRRVAGGFGDRLFLGLGFIVVFVLAESLVLGLVFELDLICLMCLLLCGYLFALQDVFVLAWVSLFGYFCLRC